MILRPSKEEVKEFLNQEGNEVRLVKYRDPEESYHTNAEVDTDRAVEAFDDSVDSWDAVYIEASEESSYELKLGGSRAYEAPVARHFRNQSDPTSREHHSLEITGELTEEAESLEDLLERN